MAETAYDRRLLWGAIALGVLLVASLLWNWNLGNTLARLDQRSQQLGDQLPDLVPLDRAKALEQRQAELEAQIAAIKIPDLAPVQKDVDGLAGRLANVETALGAIKPPDLTEVDAKLEGVRTDLKTLQTQLGDFAPARVDALSGQLNAVSQRVTALETPARPDLAAEIDRLGSRLTAVETTVADVTATGPDSLQGRLDALASRLAALPDTRPLAEQMGTVTANIESLRTAVAAAPTAERVGAIETHVAELGAQVTGAATALAQARTDAAALSSRVADVTAALATKADSAAVATLASQLDALAKQVADLPTTDTKPLESNVASLLSRLDALEQQVQALPPASAVATLRNDLDALATRPPPSVRPPQVLERIYFGSSGTSVAASEQEKLDAIARRLAAAPGPLALVGFSDSKGPAELNRSLSLRRAAAVRLALLKAGVDPAALTSVTGLGEDAPPVATGDNTVEAQNRVVLIYGY
ncbi:MAG: hypothetical protein BGO82_13510 [Devosia sp. 67-54]|uniref:OmpA family protein n=1 Tax=unclassified Devosia TaxID=196773 RepID=UPI00095A26D1|nr:MULTISPECIES: OmpA family protein [unclassified Devosia]MBN9306635.1 OmpA family protein [Devosia sp.]OJX15911.1 MAG: hypothetical protein BGO82_13510 [Devosia sp. 67-54]